MKTVAEMANQAAVYIPFNGDAIRISYVDNDLQMIFGYLEDDDQRECNTSFDDVDLENDMFYQLVVIDPNN
jgi:hypothetical protein